MLCLASSHSPSNGEQVGLHRTAAAIYCGQEHSGRPGTLNTAPIMQLLASTVTNHNLLSKFSKSLHGLPNMELQQEQSPETWLLHHTTLNSVMRIALSGLLLGAGAAVHGPRRLVSRWRGVGLAAIVLMTVSFHATLTSAHQCSSGEDCQYSGCLANAACNPNYPGCSVLQYGCVGPENAVPIGSWPSGDLYALRSTCVFCRYSFCCYWPGCTFQHYEECPPNINCPAGSYSAGTDIPQEDVS
jgi:hypothetical protein